MRWLTLTASAACCITALVTQPTVSGDEKPLAGVLAQPKRELKEVKNLTQALAYADSTEPDECIHGLKAIPKFAPAKKDLKVVLLVQKCCGRPEPEIRAVACQVAGELTKLAPEYRSACAFYYLLSDPDKNVRQAAISALPHDLNSILEIQALIRLLKDEDPLMRANAYGRLGLAAERARVSRSPDDVVLAVPAVIAKLDTESADGDPAKGERNMLRAAIDTLGKIGRRSTKTVPALLKVYDRFPADNKRDAEVRRAVVQALAEIGPYSDKSLPFLAKMIRNEKRPFEERVWAAWAIGYFGPLAADLVPEMVALLRVELKQPNPKRDNAGAIIRAFVRLEDAAEPAVPLLLELAQGNEKDDVTKDAIRALGDLAPITRTKAAPILAKIYFSKNLQPPLDSVVGMALMKFEEVATPFALEALKSDEFHRQSKAINLLGALGPNAKDALPILKQMAADDQHKFQTRAKLAVQGIDRW